MGRKSGNFLFQEYAKVILATEQKKKKREFCAFGSAAADFRSSVPSGAVRRVEAGNHLHSAHYLPSAAPKMPGHQGGLIPGVFLPSACAGLRPTGRGSRSASLQPPRGSHQRRQPGPQRKAGQSQNFSREKGPLRTPGCPSRPNAPCFVGF